ncbi:MAG: hypothetical protein AABY28_02550 [Candidatus Omnitrophota bacterium]
MTEQEFWSFFKKSCKGKKGQQEDGRVSEKDIVTIGDILFEKDVRRGAKEVIIMTLAHQHSDSALTILTKYNLNPDPGLKFFAEFALEECMWWNE